jgi:AcrR family transcriptional regulator
MIPHAERADARANRARLIAAAHEVFRERGLDAEMKEIAERAGLGIGTIYRNFPTKDDLIAAIVLDAIASMKTNLSAIATIDDPVEALRAFLDQGFAVVDRYGDVLLGIMQGQMPAACRREFEELARLDQVASVIRRGIDRGIFRDDLDPEVAAAHLIASFVPWDYHRLRRTRTPDQIARGHLDLLLHGFLTEAGAATTAEGTAGTPGV